MTSAKHEATRGFELHEEHGETIARCECGRIFRWKHDPAGRSGLAAIPQAVSFAIDEHASMHALEKRVEKLERTFAAVDRWLELASVDR